MAAPVIISNGSDAVSGTSGFTNVTHGIGAQANVFMMLVIFAQKNSASPIAVSTVTDNVGNVWQRYAGQQNTAQSATSPGPTNNTNCDQEVWWTYGSVTNGGTFSFTLDAVADGIIYHFVAMTGANAVRPFDLHSSFPGLAHNVASADVSATVSSNTNNIQAIIVGSRAANSDAGDPKYTTGAAGDGGSDRGLFSSTNNMRSKLRYKAFTSAVSALGCGYTAALSNGPVTNMNVIAFAVTADAQVVSTDKFKASVIT